MSREKDPYLDALGSGAQFMLIHAQFLKTIQARRAKDTSNPNVVTIMHQHDDSFFLMDSSVYTVRLQELTREYSDAPTYDEQVAVVGRIERLTREFCERFALDEHGRVTFSKATSNAQTPNDNDPDDGFAERKKPVMLQSFDAISSSKPSREYTYKRSTHFRNCIKQITGERCKTIPASVIERIEEYIHVYGIDPVSITPEVMRGILKRVEASILYDEATSLACEFNKTYKPLVILHEHESELLFMFQCIEEPFERVKGKRRNFLSYPYTASKLCEVKSILLKDIDPEMSDLWYSYAPHFNLLKGTERLIEHDRIWKLICEQMQWPFINTIGDVSLVNDFRNEQ